MATTLKKFSALLLALGMIFILSFPSMAHAADTGGSDHFELTVVENKDSKSGAEIADLTIKNISGKTGTNVTFEADLPTIFHDKDLKKATFNVGTLKAGDTKTYQVSRQADGTVTTTPLPTTGNTTTGNTLPTTGASSTTTKTSTPLPTTGEQVSSALMVLGLVVLVTALVIAIKHRKVAKHLLALVLLIAGLGSAATVIAAEKTYHHRDEVRNHAVELAGTTHVFHLAAEGDFEGDPTDSGDKGETGDKGEPGEPGVSNNFTITYYINDKEVTDLDPDGYIAGVKTTYLPIPTFTNDNFSGWYATSDLSGDVITSIAKTDTGDKTFYGKTTPKAHQVTFDLKGGYFQDLTATTQEVAHGAKVTQPTDPVKNDDLPNDEIPKDVNDKSVGSVPDNDFEFKGWYTDKNLTTKFDFVTPIIEGITLYAKWGLPMTEAGTNNLLSDYTDNLLGNQGDTVWISNAWWRLLNDDGLAIRQRRIENSTYHFQDGDAINGSDLKYYDNIDDDGYTRSKLKATIDNYYNKDIKNTEYEAFVRAVELNNPTFSEYSISKAWETLPSALSWDLWNENNPLNNSKFPLKHQAWKADEFSTYVDTGDKQAFAMSVSDVVVNNLITGFELNYSTNDTDHYNSKLSKLLALENYDWCSYYLRSPGWSSEYITYVYTNTDKTRIVMLDNPVKNNINVFPSLYLKIDK